MLRIHCSKGDEKACARYFDQHLDVGDYYFKDSDNEPSHWFGKGAERLGLTGHVQREAFHALLNNQHPNTAKKLTPRTNKNRRCGYDFSFSVPKGVSIAYLIGGDERIKTAFLQAVRSTMSQIEREAKSRFRDKGADYDITTGNLVWSEHVHKTARPVNGICDPQLHVHCYVQNLTWREDKGRFMALQVGDIKAEAPRFQAMYFKQLQNNLRALGYEIEQGVKDQWDVAGISKEVKEKFSRRTQQIEQRAKELNITDPKQKATLGAMTRESKKTQRLTYGKQEAEWKLRAVLAGYAKRKRLTNHQRSLRHSFKKYEEKQGRQIPIKRVNTAPFVHPQRPKKPPPPSKVSDKLNQLDRELKMTVPKQSTVAAINRWRDFQR